MYGPVPAPQAAPPHSHGLHEVAGHNHHQPQYSLVTGPGGQPAHHNHQQHLQAAPSFEYGACMNGPSMDAVMISQHHHHAVQAAAAGQTGEQAKSSPPDMAAFNRLLGMIQKATETVRNSLIH